MKGGRDDIAHYVLLHGSPGSSRGWQPLLDRAPAGAICQAWDLLDHGDRDAPQATLDDIVADVVARTLALGVRDVTLVGHSFGSWVAGWALPELTGTVRRFVAIAGLAGLSTEVAQRSRGFADALETGQITLVETATAAADLWLPTVGRDPAHVEWLRTLIEGDRIDRLARVLRRQGELAEASRRVPSSPIAATSIHNQGDRAVPVALGRELASRFERAELVALDGDGHFPHWTHADRVAHAVFAGVAP